MKLLVIGGQGQLARSLAEVRKPRGLTIAALGRPEVDLLKLATIVHAIDRIKPDLVINAAAYTAVDQAESDPGLAYAINAEGAGRVAELCALRKTPLIHISTDYIFGGCRSGPHREDCPAAPLNIYGHSKLEGERRVIAACPQHVILRTAWLYSPFGHNFVKTILRLAEGRSELGIVDDQIGSPTYAPHLALGVLIIASKILRSASGSVPWGIYHAAGSGGVTWFRFAREVFRQSEKFGGPVARVCPITTAEYSTLARRPADSRLDCSRCACVFGVRLPDWTIGVTECVARLVMGSGEQALIRGTARTA